MRRRYNFLAIIIIIIGLVSLAGAAFSSVLLNELGISATDYSEFIANRKNAVEKISVMISTLTDAVKNATLDTEWQENADNLLNSAIQSYDEIKLQSDASKWNMEYENWKKLVESLNSVESEDVKSLKKEVKSINRQAKNVNETIESWQQYEDSLTAFNFDLEKSVQSFCIRNSLVLMIFGVLCVIVGIFTFPIVRETIAKSRQTVGYLFVAPALVFILMFVAYPMIYNLVLSVKDVNMGNLNYPETQHFVGLDNFKELFTDVDNQMTGSIVNTLIFTVGSIFFQFIIGFLLALLFRNKFPLCKFIRGAIMISWLIPVTVSGLLFKFMFGMNGGIINQFLSIFGIQPIEWLYSVDYAMPAVIIANIWIGIPFNMILLLTGLTTIPNEVYESAELDGARGLKRLFYITIPMIKPAIMSVLTLGFVYTFKVFDLVKVMTSGGPVNRTQLVSIYAYKLAFKNYEYSMGAAAGTIMLIILLAEGLLYIKVIQDDEVM